jgi:hypothetical protein
VGRKVSTFVDLVTCIQAVTKMRKKVRQKNKCFYRFMHNCIEDTERSYIIEAHPDLFRVATLRALEHYPTFPFCRLTNLFTHGRDDKFASVMRFVLIDTD